MIVSKKILYAAISGSIIFFAMLHGMQTSNIFSSIFSVVFLSVVPGFLIYDILTNKLSDKLNVMLVVIGLSIAFLIFGGLFINAVLPYFGIDQPLTLVPLVVAIVIATSSLTCISYKVNVKEQFEYDINISKYIFPYVVLVCTLILSVCGSISLNNSGTNLWTGAALLIISIFVLWIITSKSEKSDNFYGISIVLMALSLLLMASLRSWHIAGWDINRELEVFHITKTIGRWSFDNFKNDYNACLSITILPTILSRFVSFSDEYIFKIIFQAYFALVPGVMYALFRKFTSMKKVAFLAAFYFIAQPFFVQPMPALIRQETAFLFLTLLLLMLYSSVPKFQKELLIAVFGVSMVLSHYSTTYVSIAYFICTYLLINVIELINIVSKYSAHRKQDPVFPNDRNILILKVIVLLSLSVFWYPIVTNSSNNPYNVLIDAASNISNSFTYDLKSNDISEALSIFSKKDTRDVQADINAYINPTIENFDSQKYYPPESYQDYKPVAPPEETVSPLIKSRHNADVIKILDLVKLLTKLFVLFGSLFIIIRFFRLKKFNNEFPLMIFGALLSVIIIMIIPILSLQYNLSRLYMQALILLALPATTGGLAFFHFFTKKFGLLCLTLSYLICFTYLSGFLSIVLGGQAHLQLNNFGDDYRKFYTYEQEVVAAKWLASNRNPLKTVYADEVSALRLISFGEINNIDTQLIPKSIIRDSYVFARFENIHSGRTDVTYLKKHIIFYSFPSSFLSANKNLIYNNGGSEIFN